MLTATVIYRVKSYTAHFPPLCFVCFVLLYIVDVGIGACCVPRSAKGQ